MIKTTEKMRLYYYNEKKRQVFGLGGLSMDGNRWIFCPICNSKTRTQIRKETELKHFPLFCPKCKEETLINVKEQKVTIVKGG